MNTLNKNILRTFTEHHNNERKHRPKHKIEPYYLIVLNINISTSILFYDDGLETKNLRHILRTEK